MNEAKERSTPVVQRGVREGRARVGVVMASPLLGLGLVTIMEEGLPVQAVMLRLEEVTEASNFAAVILDARCLPDDLCAAITRLRKKLAGIKIIAVGWALPAEEVQKIIGAGAKGYLLESAGEAEIRMAVEVVLDGSIWAPRKVLARLVDAGTSLADAGEAAEQAIEELSARELEVMDLLKDGRSNREIAIALGIEQATVKAHLGRMLRKTRCKNRLEMTLRCVQQQNASAAHGTG